MNNDLKNMHLWCNTLSDYQAMFALTTDDCKGRILDCYSGPASFNAELTALGGKVISADPLYARPLHDLEKLVLSFFEKQSAVMTVEHDSVATYLGDRREHVMQFLKDLPIGLKQERYQAKELYDLDFPDFHFDLALCSHYLFSNSSVQSVEFYVGAIKKLCALAREVRIFPMFRSPSEISSLLGPIMLALLQFDYGVEVKSVQYQQDKKANTMLRVWAQTCVVNSDNHD